MIWAILLAAGTSTRMGRANKLLLDYHGQPLVRHVAVQLQQAQVDGVLVVTGFEAKAIKTALDGLDLETVHNPKYEQGMSTSIKCGVSAIEREVDFMICLSDMPLLEAQHYSDLADTFRQISQQGDTPIVKPSLTSGAGNPVVFHHAFREAVLQMPDGNTGCKPVVAQNRSHLVELPVSGTVFSQDIDNPDQYRWLMYRTTSSS